MYTYDIVGHDVKDYPFTTEHEPSTVGTVLMAEDAAEDFHSNHDGWETSWPLTFVIKQDGQVLGTFEVDRDTVPEFNAYPARIQ